MRPPGEGRRRLLERHAELCKVFSNPTRLAVLEALRGGEGSVQEIARAIGAAAGTVSPHLLLMRARRVLASRREGARVYYRLDNPKLGRAFDLIHEILTEQLRKEAALAAEPR